MSKIVLTSLDLGAQVFQLLNAIDDVHAWIKDRDGKFVLVNRRFCQRFGFDREEEMVGLTDYAIAPDYLADGYVEDDQRVLDGAIISDRLELIVNTGESPSWFNTSKWPIYNPEDEIIGSFGVSRHLNETHSSATPFRELNTPIEYIRQRFSENISVKRLAEACHVSISTLERRFKKHLSKTPQQYITEVRLDHARMMIHETEKSLSNIAQETGFVDNSHFTRAYKKRFCMSPSEARKAQKERLQTKPL